MKANEIMMVLDQFQNTSHQKILFNGNWGIGKTKYVMDFIGDYSDSCYVSLFGKKDVNSIIQEIYFHILDNAPIGRVKKLMNIFKEKLNTFDVSYFGVSLSIPLIASLHKDLNKELGRKENFIIVFDDLERKHSDLDIKEIFGLVDSFSKIEKIKIVLIAATDQFEKEDLEDFKNYQEKAIDRIYKIEEYANDAPMQILGENVWGVIGGLLSDFSFSNLRTFEKINLFIKEVLWVLGEENFTDKFTKNDIYRMCFATVFFIVENGGELILLDTKDDDNANFMKAHYTGSENGKIDYMCTYILQNSLDNELSKGVFHLITKWYETGAYSKGNLIEAINSINNYKEKPHNFCSSEQDILNIINQAKLYIRNLNGSESINNIILELNTAITWCEVFSIDFGYGDEDILQLIQENIGASIDLTKNMEENEIVLWHQSYEGKAGILINLINERIKTEYFNKLMSRIINSFNQKTYEYSYLRELEFIINQYSEMIFIKENLKLILSENQYLFPIPNGRITESQWSWCLKIKKIVIAIERRWSVDNYYNEFKSFVCESDPTERDKMFQHRTRELFK